MYFVMYCDVFCDVLCDVFYHELPSNDSFFVFYMTTVYRYKQVCTDSLHSNTAAKNMGITLWAYPGLFETPSEETLVDQRRCTVQGVLNRLEPSLLP